MSRAAYHLGLSALALALASCGTSGGPRHPEDALDRIELAGGARVLVRESRAAPVVALQLRVLTGSADEGPQEQGVAQVFDGLLCSAAGLEAEVARLGGRLDAWTTQDETVFELVLPGASWARGLELLAQTVLRPRFDAEAVDREVGTRVARLRQSRNDPDRVLVERLFREAFQTHPYGRPVVASIDQVARLTRAQIESFHRRWYVPANMTLIVAGDVRIEDVRIRAARALSGRATASPARPPRPAEPAQRALRVALVTDDLAEARIALGFHVPPATDPEHPAIDLMTAILAHGPGSRLTRALVRERGLVRDVRATLYGPRDPGLLVLTARQGSASAIEGVAGMAAEVFRLRDSPPSRTELARARAVLAADDAWPRDTAGGLVRKLGFFASFGEDFAARYREALEQVTPRRIVEVARRVLTPRNLTAVLLGPEGSGADPTRDLHRAIVAADERERTAHRAGQRARLPGGIVREVLASGVRVIVAPRRGGGTVAVRLATLGGVRLETEATAGQAAFLSRLLTQGTRTRSAGEIASLAESIGGSVTSFSGRDALGIDGRFLTRSFAEGLELAVDCLLHAALEPAALEDERRRAVMDAQARDRDPATAADALAAELLFDPHPYRRTSLGTPAGLAGIDRARLVAFHRQLLAPERLVVAIAGDVDPEVALAYARDLLGDLPASAMALARVADVPTPVQPRTESIGRPAAATEVRVAYRGARWTAADRATFAVTAELLTARLRASLRGAGLAYDASATSAPGVEPGQLQLSVSTSAENVAAVTSAILSEVGRLAAAGPSAAELDRARRTLLSSEAFALERGDALAARLAIAELLWGGAGEALREHERLAAVQASDVRRLAQSQLLPERHVLAIVRPETGGSAP